MTDSRWSLHVTRRQRSSNVIARGALPFLLLALMLSGCVHETIYVSGGTVQEAWPRLELEDEVRTRGEEGPVISLHDEVFEIRRTGLSWASAPDDLTLQELFAQCMHDDPLACDIDGVRLVRTGLNTAAVYGGMVLVAGAVVLLAMCADGGLGCEGDGQSYALAGAIVLPVGAVAAAIWAVAISDYP